MPADCIFCKIVAKELPATILYAHDDVTAFVDIHPQATTHVLVIPNRHLGSLNDATEGDTELLGKLIQVSARIARDQGIAASGYRVVTNTGPNAQQSVNHLHFHVIGGNALSPRLG